MEAALEDWCYNSWKIHKVKMIINGWTGYTIQESSAVPKMIVMIPVSR